MLAGASCLASKTRTMPYVHVHIIVNILGRLARHQELGG